MVSPELGWWEGGVSVEVGGGRWKLTRVGQKVRPKVRGCEDRLKTGWGEDRGWW